VVCWGDGFRGQLGNRTLDNSSLPVEVVSLRGATSIALSIDSSWALRGDELSFWGYDPRVGALPMVSAPRARFTITGASELITSLGGGAMGAITRDGGAMSWGGYLRLDTGAGMFGVRDAPTPIAGLRNVTSLSVDGGASCAVADPGRTAWCWGERYGLFDAVAADPPGFQDTPVAVPGAGELVQVVVGQRAACGVTTTRGVRCWGLNESGVLGIGSADPGFHPAGPLVDLPPVREIAFGSQGVCALTMSDEVYCWGSALVLGQGSDVDRPSPILTYPGTTP